MKQLVLLLFPFLLFATETLDDLLSLSLEELMEVEVTTVSKKETNAFKSSSSIYIISQEQIRRSGLTSIPELLRLVPGLHVGRLNGNQWAINSRAPNTLRSREMRIMIDGRDLYNSFFNGVYWDSINVMLEDIERIEVVRGPGASLWGTNTAHGVINIITKNASDTQGTLVSVSVGNAQDEYVTSARYGFTHAKGSTRLYATRRQFDRSDVPSGDDIKTVSSRNSGDEAYDGHHLSQAGFVSNIDIDLENQIRISSDIYKGENEEQSKNFSLLNYTKGANLHLSYESELSLNSNIGIDAYVDYFSRKDDRHNNKMRMIDVSFQHIYTEGRHSIVWGAEYKNSLNEATHTGGDGILAVSPERQIDEVRSVFFQDDISFQEKTIVFTPSLKYSHNDYTNDTYQPSLRLAYYPNEYSTLWTSATRSEAEPSRLAIGGYIDFRDSGFIIPLHDGTIQSNIINTYEFGYRQQLSERLLLDNTVFYDDYKQKGNDGTDADYIYGYELNSKYALLKEWKLEMSYAFHYGKNRVKGKELPINTLAKHTISASSFYTYKEHTDIDLMYYFLDSTNTTSSYSRIDLRLEHRPLKNLRLSVTGQNLLEKEHVEANADGISGNSVVQRAFIAKVTYTF